MFKKLSDYYFLKALELAKRNNLTDAVRYAAVSVAIYKENNNNTKLAGLCYYRLGNYVMAEYCFQNSEYFNETIKDILLRKKNQLKIIKQYIDNNQYKKVIRTLEKDDEKNVLEYHYLGCLYAAFQKNEKAIFNFLEALKVDHANKDTLRYLKNVNVKKKGWWLH